MGKPEQPTLTDDQLSVLADAAQMVYKNYKPYDPKIEQALVSAVQVIFDHLEAVGYAGSNPDFKGYQDARKWFAEQVAA